MENILRVTTTVDENDGSATEGTGLSLRDAVLIANSTAEDEIIELESGQVYDLTIVNSGDLDIASTGGTLTIRGLGEGATIDANQIDRVLHVRGDDNGNGATLVLENITITGGQSAGIFERGGGGILIDNRATAQLIDCTITGNSTRSTFNQGGGITNEGVLSLNNCVVSNNVANNGGGIFTEYGITTIVDSTITNNTANGNLNFGGGVNHNGAGTTEIINSIISDNTSDNGGGVYITDGLSSRKGSLKIVDSIISGNTAKSGGGILSSVIESSIIENTVIENNTADFGGGIFHLGGFESNTPLVENSTIQNNLARGDGGGIYADDDLIIRNSTISGNRANDDGGGVYSDLSTVRLYDSLVDNNSAGGDGGGLYDVKIIRGSTISNNTATEDGGGLKGSIAIIVDSTISGNTSDGSGGGIQASGGLLAYYAMAISNTTISGNSAKEFGGGINVIGGLNSSSRTELFRNGIVATNVTITDNLADSDNDGSGDGGGIHNPSFFRTSDFDEIIPGDVIFRNSILEGNFDTPENNGQGIINPDISGPARGNANNLIGNLTGLTISELYVAPEAESLGQGSDITGVSSLLGTLEDNGGNTFTHTLLTGSPAINAGNNDNIPTETLVDVNGDGTVNTLDLNGDGDTDDSFEFDQRGENYSRIFGNTVDIGAYEVQEDVNNLPIVANPIGDITVEEDAENQTIDLSNVFDDVDSDNIQLEVVNNSNSDLVTPLLNDNDLTLDFADNQSGTADITIRATADGQSVEDTFTVTVGSTDDSLFNTKINRFQNNDISGTYIFAKEDESQNIRDNFSNFTEEGFAFNVADEPADNLIPLYRFQSLITPGTYLFAKEAEREDIKENFSESFAEEGLAFYVYEVGTGIGTELTRFQNRDNPGTYLFAQPDEAERIRNDFPSFVEEGAAFEVVV